MKSIIFSIFFITLLFLNCGSDYQNHSEGYINFDYVETFNTDLLSHEMTFGSEESGTKDEFLLVSPTVIRVNNEGDIIFGDECCIKVFDKHGIGKKLIGRRGQGPGEFETDPRVFLSPTDYIITLANHRIPTNYSIFSPDYGFIDKKNLRFKEAIGEYLKTKGINSINNAYLRSAYALNNSEKIYHLIINYRVDEIANEVECIIYENNGDFTPLVFYKNPAFLLIEKVIYVVGQDIGNSSFGMLTGKRFWYMTTDDDTNDTDSGSYYKIHIISIETHEDKQIIRQFTPIPYPDTDVLSETFKIIFGSSSSSQKRYRGMINKLIEVYKKRKFIPSVELITVDGNYAFVFLKNQFPIPGKFDKEKEFHVDVFDMKSCKFIKSFKSPKLFSTIKDGYVYENALDTEGFEEIRKYKIDPAVYGK